MQYNIFIGGGGDIPQSVHIDSMFFGGLLHGSKILYIPVAMNENQISYDACADWFTKLITANGGDKDIDFAMWREADPVPQVADFDAVYIGGGNTYYLKEVLDATGIGMQIINFATSGGVVYGGSAGAIILGNSILTVGEENDKNKNNHEGYGALGRYSVRCHYEGGDEDLRRLSKAIGPIFAIPETAGIAFAGVTYAVAGSTVYVFENGIRSERQVGQIYE